MIRPLWTLDRECEYCAKIVGPVEIIINGYHFHKACFRSQPMEQQVSETEFYMSLPHPRTKDNAHV